MVRAVQAAVVDRPAWRRGALRVEGPDEDGFTLAVAALEGLRATARFRGAAWSRVQIVGPFPEPMLPGVGEAMGDPALEVRLDRGGAPELYESLSTAAAGPGAAGPEAVVVVETAAGSGPEAYGAGAVAFGIDDGPGVTVHPHGERHHPVERRPDASQWVATVRRAVDGASEPSGILWVRASSPPPVLLKFWGEALPGLVVEPAPPVPDTLGPAPHLGPALDLVATWESDRAGPWRVLATIRADRTVYAGYSVDGAFEVRGARAPPEPELTWPGRSAGAEETLLGRVAQGAYLPRPSYLESRPSRWRFVADRCAACGHRTFPARGVCRACGTTEGLTADPLPLDGGRIEARTTVHAGAQPTEFDPWVEAAGAYDVALVRLAEDVVATLPVTDASTGSMAPGAPVRTALRRLFPMEGEWRYGRKATPA